MLLVLENDGCLHVYGSPEEAALAIGALEVEGRVWKAYDVEARPYRIEWTRPNRYGKTHGFLASADGGEYRFVAAGAAEPSSALEMLHEARAVLPESAAEPVREIERRLQERCAAGSP